MEFPQQSDLRTENLKNRRIWVIDDDSDLREAYSEYLEEYFNQVQAFSSARSALEFLKRISKEVHPQIILTDQCMSGLDGISFARLIQNFTQEIDLIMVSGKVNLLTEAQAFQLNIFCILEKPCAPECIRQAIDRHITQKYS